MSYAEFDHREVLEFIERTFRTDCRMPDQVFRNEAALARIPPLFSEFDAVLTPDLWPAISALAKSHGDDKVYFSALEPMSESSREEGCGQYSSFALPTAASVDDYWERIGFEPDGDVMGSLAISANVIALSGESGDWGCWGERDPEIAIISGFRSVEDRRNWEVEYGPFYEAEEVLTRILPLTFPKNTVPDSYAAKFGTNYGLSKSGGV